MSTLDWSDQPLHMLSATTLAKLVQARDISLLEVVSASLERISKLDPKLNAHTAGFSQKAMVGAIEIQRLVDSGENLGPLAGVPYSVKDAIWVAGEVAANGSVALRGFAIRPRILLMDETVERSGSTNPSSCSARGFGPTSCARCHHSICNP